MQALHFWWQYTRAPLAFFAVAASVLATTWTDVAIAQTIFFDPARMQWIGEGSWWANDFLHVGGRWAVRGIVAIALALWVATYLDSELRALRRAAAYFVMSVALCVGVVGLLKMSTNVDCPWDLSEFGGDFPFVHLFADRSDALRYGHCFPAAHASSGYALVALYFVFRERYGLLAKLGLGLGMLAGLIFGIAQQSRGAHFVSHDLWSAFIVWMISLALYSFAFKARLWHSAQPSQAGPRGHEAPVAAGRLVVGGSAPVRCGVRGLPGAPHQ